MAYDYFGDDPIPPYYAPGPGGGTRAPVVAPSDLHGKYPNVLPLYPSAWDNVFYQKETGGLAHPDTAVSSMGAVGKAQIMPETGAPYLGMSIPEARNELLNPDANRFVYRSHVNDLYHEFGNDPEAVSIGYFAGVGKAREWLAAGRDNSVLGPKTQAYMKDFALKVGGAVSGRTAEAGAGAPRFDIPAKTPEVPPKPYDPTARTDMSGLRDLSGVQKLALLSAMMRGTPVTPVKINYDPWANIPAQPSIPGASAEIPAYTARISGTRLGTKPTTATSGTGDA